MFAVNEWSALAVALDAALMRYVIQADKDDANAWLESKND